MPTLEEDDGFTLGESNAIVRYLGARYGAGKLEPSDPKVRGKAQSWMDWQLSVANLAIFPVFWGLVRTPPEKRDPKTIEDGKQKCTAAIKIMDSQLARTRFIAGDQFSYGDIPMGRSRFIDIFALCPIIRRCRMSSAGTRKSAHRPAFKEHVLDVPFT